MHDKLGGGPIARPQRLGVLFVGRHFYSLELEKRGGVRYRGALGGSNRVPLEILSGGGRGGVDAHQREPSRED